MARTGAVAVVVLGSLLALMQFEAALANPVSANVQSTGFVGGSSSGAAQSQIVENDGTIKGECAYVGPDGNTIKIAYQQPPNGQLVAESNTPGVDPATALATCRRAAEAASLAAQQNFQQVQEMIRQQQLQLQALQARFQVPNFFGFPNQFQFPGFGHF